MAYHPWGSSDGSIAAMPQFSGLAFARFEIAVSPPQLCERL
jgi:hypothetical protein